MPLSRNACWAALALVAPFAGGCRACNETPSEAALEAGGPPMPSGLLAPPPPSGGLAERGSVPERLALGRGAQGGEWVELQPGGADDAPDRRSFERWRTGSRFLSLEAMALLHEAFGRALPGFDLFLPRRFDGEGLERLRDELGALKSEVSGIPTAGAAKARWSGAAILRDVSDDAAWIRARTAFVATIDGLIAFATELRKGGQSLWVLGI